MKIVTHFGYVLAAIFSVGISARMANVAIIVPLTLQAGGAAENLLLAVT